MCFIILKFELMRNMLSIFFLSLYVFSTTELFQLLKLPVLIEHYLEHKALDGTLSISEFMTIHYAEDHLANHPHDDDYDQDKRLPFMATSLTLNFVFVSPTIYFLESIKVDQEIPDIKIPYQNDRLAVSTFLSTIWQPPRIS